MGFLSGNALFGTSGLLFVFATLHFKNAIAAVSGKCESLYTRALGLCIYLACYLEVCEYTVMEKGWLCRNILSIGYTCLILGVCGGYE